MYGSAASWRRRWYANHPTRVRHLARPVISVGNLRVGGSGKTPIVAHLARLLVQRGERPSILIRGYARTKRQRGVTVVSNRSGVLAGVALAGDEALMLARALPGVPVLVGADRFASGTLAEHDFDVTVHLLDDGFQHLTLGRDLDLLLIDETDLGDAVLPAGRLREPIVNGSAADALLVTGRAAAVERVSQAVPVSPVFRVVRALAEPRTLAGTPLDGLKTERVFALAGIARPERFFADLTAAGWNVVGTQSYRDHHPFSAADIGAIRNGVRGVKASLVLTTEKDAMRLEDCDLIDMKVGVVPLTAVVEPAERFTSWLFERLTALIP